MNHDTDSYQGADSPCSPRPRRRPQFTLRALMLGVAVVAGLLGLITTVSPLWSVIVVWFVILVVGHVLGNWLGTTINRQRRAEEQDSERPSHPAVHFAPTSRLRHHVVLGWTMFISAAASALVGCCLGVLYLTRYSEFADRLTPSGLLVGALSSTVIGGLFGFLTSSFLTVTACALHEACGGRKNASLPVEGGNDLQSESDSN
jgi:amino acid transporter